MRWIYVGLIVGSTAISDVLQSREMKDHGQVNGLGRVVGAIMQRRALLLAIFFLAVSFFAFLKLLSMSDLSFAVPATALSFVVETMLAKWLLKERVDWMRWTGALLVAIGVAFLAR